MKSNLFLVGFFLGFGIASAHAADAGSDSDKSWYDRLSLKGYAQVRYNRLLETNSDLVCDLCDKSLGEDQNFFVRRARITLSGNVHERLFIYIQPDLASNASDTSQHFLQIRDLYADLSILADDTLRIRVGQSKVPFGWENLQSSSNRLALDRSDPINSGAPNERDLGAFVYWAPTEIRARLKDLQNPYLKGTGDYGILGFGAYNGQTANRPEQNDNLHLVARATYPFRLANGQYFEASVQGYTGLFTIAGRAFRDERAAATFVWYPQPFGFQIEANTGVGPEYQGNAGAIERREVRGGYAQVMMNAFEPDETRLIGYARAQFYRGGKKTEPDSRAHLVRELEIGGEWAPFAAFELTAAYAISARRTNDSADGHADQRGNRLRLQAQFNY